MKAWGGGSGNTALSSLAPDVDGWSMPCAGLFTPEKDSGTHPLYRRLGGPRGGLDGCGRLRPYGCLNPEQPRP